MYVSIPKVDIYEDQTFLVTTYTYTLTTQQPNQFIFTGELSECLEFLDSRGCETFEPTEPTKENGVFTAIFCQVLN